MRHSDQIRKNRHDAAIHVPHHCRMTRLLGAVLAGGRSSRFGSDKADALWRGRPLVEHAAESLRPFVDDLILCGRAYGAHPSIADRPAADMGPLGGLCAALHHARMLGFASVLTVGCDTPSIPAVLLDRLRATVPPAYVANLPVIGHWPALLAEPLDAFLREDRKHAVRGWGASVGAEAIDWPMLANVNEPGDLSALPAGDE